MGKVNCTVRGESWGWPLGGSDWPTWPESGPLEPSIIPGVPAPPIPPYNPDAPGPPARPYPPPPKRFPVGDSITATSWTSYISIYGTIIAVVSYDYYNSSVWQLDWIEYTSGKKRSWKIDAGTSCRGIAVLDETSCLVGYSNKIAKVLFTSGNTDKRLEETDLKYFGSYTAYPAGLVSDKKHQATAFVRRAGYTGLWSYADNKLYYVLRGGTIVTDYVLQTLNGYAVGTHYGDPLICVDNERLFRDSTTNTSCNMFFGWDENYNWMYFGDYYKGYRYHVHTGESQKWKVSTNDSFEVGMLTKDYLCFRDTETGSEVIADRETFETIVCKKAGVWLKAKTYGYDFNLFAEVFQEHSDLVLYVTMLPNLGASRGGGIPWEPCNEYIIEDTGTTTIPSDTGPFLSYTTTSWHNPSGSWTFEEVSS